MIEVIVESIVEFVPRTIGWAVLKVVTFGRYHGFTDGDRLVEGAVGLLAIAGACYGIYVIVR